MTGARVLHVRKAAHIRTYASGGEHRVDNGRPLQSDLRTLLKGDYMTVTPSLDVEVSQRIREDSENGRHCSALHGERVTEPTDRRQRLSAEFLRWHN